MRLHPGATRTWLSNHSTEQKTVSGRTELGNKLAVILLWRLHFDIFRHCLFSSIVSSLSGTCSVLSANLLLVRRAEIANQLGQKKGMRGHSARLPINT